MKVYQDDVITSYRKEKKRMGLTKDQDFRLVPKPAKTILGDWKGRYFGIKWWYHDEPQVYDTYPPYEEIPF